MINKFALEDFFFLEETIGGKTAITTACSDESVLAREARLMAQRERNFGSEGFFRVLDSSGNVVRVVDGNGTLLK